MVSLNQLVAVCLMYVAGLFIVAFAAERAALRGQGGWLLRSPLVYTLSLSIYCTAWTFYGAVGYAAPVAGDDRLVVGLATAGAHRAEPPGDLNR